MPRKKTTIALSPEQQNFISHALFHKNILVDACIGSGKTTAIQHLCNELPTNLNVLYLTYNKLLKIDAQAKIKNKNVKVTNYHGFAYIILQKLNQSAGVSDLLQSFNAIKPPIPKYDVLIIDEYQDIDQEISELLLYIKSTNPSMQIVAVGDMEQKIYDKTTLDVLPFIEDFLGEHIKLKFTQCFRLSHAHAARLGKIWKKEIVGVNETCLVEQMNLDEVVSFLSTQECSDILCLGARTGQLSDVLNRLEAEYPEKFNKQNTYASIYDNDNKITPKKNSAIFTTYDSSKGLERPVCVIFDFNETYWGIRIKQPQQSYKILRNIFCVAASRGKNRIIFVESDQPPLSDETLSTEVEKSLNFRPVNISEMFDFKYKENVEDCFHLLQTKPLTSRLFKSVIDIKNHDENIDLSPCIGIYQEALFFDKYSIDTALDFSLLFNRKKQYLYTEQDKTKSLEEKILILTALETKQDRYKTQVTIPFIQEVQKAKIIRRLGTTFKKNENDVQSFCRLEFCDEDFSPIFSAFGRTDVVKDDIVYELKFVNELTHEHYLQCACYMIALGLKKGILWNVRDNSKFLITIPDEKKFMDAVTTTITKEQLTKYYPPSKHFAVIDTETNYNNQVMSIGIVIADISTYKPISSKYFIIDSATTVGGMYSNKLPLEKAIHGTYLSAIANIRSFLKEYNVHKLFAYNASFDFTHLPDLKDFQWFDIMQKAAYKQHNHAIPENAECCKTGRLKCNYSVEAIMRLLTGNKSYHETHNALLDAYDELKLIQLLNIPITKYTPL